MFHSLGFLLVVIISIIPFWKICERVGHSPWLSLLMLIPLINIIFIYYIAFGEWPSQKGPAAT
jgi:heme/copper-type cytochrome/quinol oxidase subunit 4